MKNPMHINLMTPEQVKAGGWGAESRDADGHLISTHIPFERDEEIVRFVREAIGDGETVTIWQIGDSDE